MYIFARRTKGEPFLEVDENGEPRVNIHLGSTIDEVLKAIGDELSREDQNHIARLWAGGPEEASERRFEDLGDALIVKSGNS